MTYVSVEKARKDQQEAIGKDMYFRDFMVKHG